MFESLKNRAKHIFNIFTRDPPNEIRSGDYSRPDRVRLNYVNDRTIIASILNRIALDCSEVEIRHIKVDENGKYIEEINSGINGCLSVSANIDQTGQMLIQDAVLRMLDEGVVAIVPVDIGDDGEIETLRAGSIKQWYPQHISVQLYNERNGQKREIIVPKATTAIIQNPFYAVMNEPNSTLQRLSKKLNQMDAIDEMNGSGKLDMIIQLPYVVKSEERQKAAEKRRKDLEEQLANSKFGIGYIDGTEHITQLNRAVENNLMGQVDYLTNMLYSQLCMTPELLNGSANETTMLNYNNRVIGMIMTIFRDEFIRKFLTVDQRENGETMQVFRDPFKLVPVSQIAEIADKFTRNEILTSNEVRKIIGYKPSDDENADILRNKNLSQSKEELIPHTETKDKEGEIQNG